GTPAPIKYFAPAADSKIGNPFSSIGGALWVVPALSVTMHAPRANLIARSSRRRTQGGRSPHSHTPPPGTRTASYPASSTTRRTHPSRAARHVRQSPFFALRQILQRSVDPARSMRNPGEHQPHLDAAQRPCKHQVVEVAQVPDPENSPLHFSQSAPERH